MEHRTYHIIRSTHSVIRPPPKSPVSGPEQCVRLLAWILSICTQDTLFRHTVNRWGGPIDKWWNDQDEEGNAALGRQCIGLDGWFYHAWTYSIWGGEDVHGDERGSGMPWGSDSDFMEEKEGRVQRAWSLESLKSGWTSVGNKWGWCKNFVAGASEKHPVLDPEHALRWWRRGLGGACALSMLV